jgi:hypothetical protein
MAQTRRQLIDKVLDKLGVLVPGQAPGDEAVSRVDGYIDPCFATLAALGVVYVADAGVPDPPSGGAIDDPIVNPLADYVAWACAGAFNLGDNPQLKLLSDQAESTMRIIGRPASTRQTLRTDSQLRGGTRRALVGNFSRGT